jgi:hypothetical protein
MKRRVYRKRPLTAVQKQVAKAQLLRNGIQPATVFFREHMFQGSKVQSPRSTEGAHGV